MAGIRNTVQRNQIWNTVNEMKNHPTAEMISEKVSKGVSNISRATVYRNLSQLVEQGMLYKVEIPNAADRYDFRLDNHYHIRCIDCGSVLDAPISYMEELDKKLATQEGAIILGHHMVFDGLCSTCLKDRKEEICN